MSSPVLDRRQLIGAAAVAGLAGGGPAAAQAGPGLKLSRPCVVSTWDFGVAANAAAWKVLSRGGAALDAVEAGARVPEVDLKNHSVGRAGYPDRDGHVTLDASIMDQKGDCGAVAGLEHIAHPISVARRVMEKTPHGLLVGDGALQFALEQGFKREELLTPESRAAWKAWLKEHRYKPVANSEVKTYGRELGLPGGKTNHDTLGMLALDAQGNLSGACTTSGMAWKLRGRVGDSPIIGAGLYVDGEVGAATSTGVGEEVIRSCGSFLVVELMRQGRSPREACREAVTRIMKRDVARDPDFQVGFLAVNKAGEVGAFAVQKGFSYAVCDAHDQTRIVPSESLS
ncbi:MAG: N(4)-(beta-N-acetylglucosaminyl)-L-asparaginase [Proteobacteria bacterium]|nr:N(4)-(beta-N-acetylglucosaminyl)-L-asparaginase [Pseudomonadota bacterium]